MEEVAAGKKRGADKQYRREELEDIDDDVQEQTGGTWKSADEGTISTRRKVKVRRGLVPENININADSIEPAPSSSSTTPSSSDKKQSATPSSDNSNGAQSATESATSPADKNTNAESKVEQKTATPEKKEETVENKDTEKSSEEPKETATPTLSAASSFAGFNWNVPPSSGGMHNFASLASTSNTFTPSSFPTFDFLKSSSQDSQEDGVEGGETNVEIAPRANLPPPEPVMTGEEGEQNLFTCKAKCYEFDIKEKKYKERGTGILKVNSSEDGKSARVLMRADGTHRIIVNSRIWPLSKAEKHNEKAVLFVGHSESNTLTQYSFRLLDPNAPSAKAAELLSVLQKQKQTVGNATTSSSSSTSTSEASTSETTEKAN